MAKHGFSNCLYFDGLTYINKVLECVYSKECIEFYNIIISFFIQLFHLILHCITLQNWIKHILKNTKKKFVFPI